MKITIIVVIFMISFILESFMVIAKYTLKPVQLPDNLDSVRIFSDEDISQYDGVKNPDKLIYMGIKGIVFDVTSGDGFYGPGASYNALCGKDSTRAVAKMSLEPEDIKKDVSDLGDEYLKSLDDIVEGTYMTKYPVVGYMDYLFHDRVRIVHDKTDL